MVDVPEAFVRDGAPAKAPAAVNAANRSLLTNCALAAVRVQNENGGLNPNDGARAKMSNAKLNCHLAGEVTQFCEPFHRWRLGWQTADYLDGYVGDRIRYTSDAAHENALQNVVQHIPNDIKTRLRELYGQGVIRDTDLRGTGDNEEYVRELFARVVGRTVVAKLACPIK
jgi:hypothetical protein